MLPDLPALSFNNGTCYNGDNRSASTRGTWTRANYPTDYSAVNLLCLEKDMDQYPQSFNWEQTKDNWKTEDILKRTSFLGNVRRMDSAL